jgi:hypothetical protein
VCKKSYNNKPELEAHKWTHKEFAKRMQGPYKCSNSVCPFSEEVGGKRGFKFRRQLKTHIHKCQFVNGQLQREEENVVDIVFPLLTWSQMKPVYYYLHTYMKISRRMIILIQAAIQHTMFLVY